MTKPQIYAFALTLTLTGVSGITYAQQDARIALGHSFVSEDLHDGREYALWIAVVGASRKIANMGNDGRLNALAELHYGDVSTISAGKHDIDLALNLAVEVVWEFHASTEIHFSIGSGPAYHTNKSTIQAEGFLFSNNFTLGLRVAFFNKRVMLNPQVRFRHMSNARLKRPNTGIDNFLVLLGVVIPLGDN